MAEVIIMPKLGFNMDEGQLVRWNKQVGDSVKKGEVLFEINTDKTTMPVEATSDGVVLKLMLEEGDFADVFTPIAVIGSAGEDPEAALSAFQNGEAASAAEAAPAEKTSAVEPADISAATADFKNLRLTPRARKLIKDEGIDPASVVGIVGTGYQGGICSRDILNSSVVRKLGESMPAAASGVKASPLAKKVAAIKGVDLSDVSGTGFGGKIMKADVEGAAGTASTPGAENENQNLQIAEITPYKGIRRIIGEKLASSKFTAPHLYFTDSVDTTELTALRKKLNESGEVKIAVSDLLTMAACKALLKFPGVNVSIQDDRIITYKSINIGTAVAGSNGLVVPVIKNVQDKRLVEIAKESRDLIARGKEGRLQPIEYSEGTFTISNLGMFGIGNFTAIINAPEAAILSVSSVRKTPVVITDENGEDTIAIRPMMNIQLSVDHRVIDGLLASQFVEYMKELLENPVRILL